MAAPQLDLHDTGLRWPDGSLGAIRQQYFLHIDRLLQNGEALFVMPIDVVREGHATISGDLRFTAEYLAALEGHTDGEKSVAAARAVQVRLIEEPLSNGFDVMFTRM